MLEKMDVLLFPWLTISPRRKSSVKKNCAVLDIKNLLFWYFFCKDYWGFNHKAPGLIIINGLDLDSRNPLIHTTDSKFKRYTPPPPTPIQTMYHTTRLIGPFFEKLITIFICLKFKMTYLFSNVNLDLINKITTFQWRIIMLITYITCKFLTLA
jgi:hypothetical protein